MTFDLRAIKGKSKAVSRPSRASVVCLLLLCNLVAPFCAGGRRVPSCRRAGDAASITFRGCSGQARKPPAKTTPLARRGWCSWGGSCERQPQQHGGSERGATVPIQLFTAQQARLSAAWRATDERTLRPSRRSRAAMSPAFRDQLWDLSRRGLRLFRYQTTAD